MDNLTPETSSKILEAIADMQLQGLKINMRTIRAFMGKGSFSDIGPVLKQWRESQQPAQPSVPDIPETIRKSMSQSMQAIWQMAWQTLSETESTELNALKDEMLQRDIDREVLENEFFNLQLRIEGVNQDLVLCREQLKSTSDNVTSLSNELARSDERVKFLTATNEQQQDKIDHQNKKHDLLSADNAELKTLNAEQQKEIGELNRLISQADIKLAEASSSLIVCQEERDSLSNELEQKNVLLDEQNQQLQEQQLLIAQQNKQIKGFDKLISAEKSKREDAESALKEHKTLLQIEREANKIAQETIERLCNNRLNDVQQKNTQLEQEIQELKSRLNSSLD